MTMNCPDSAPHAVARLRAARLERSAKPFLARGGSRRVHCAGCRLAVSHCSCALRIRLATRAGVCLLMHDSEPLKPSNTGWLIADVVADTFAFGWARTSVDPALLALLQDPQWRPCVVFPTEGVAPARVLGEAAFAPGCDWAAPHPAGDCGAGAGAQAPAARPLFILLDGTWAEARKMFHRSPYLERFPVLGLQGGEATRYRLRHASQDDQWCTSEVAARCLQLAGDARAGALLQAWLAVYAERYDQARQQRPAQPDSRAHQRLAALRTGGDARPQLPVADAGAVRAVAAASYRASAAAPMPDRVALPAGV